MPLWMFKDLLKRGTPQEQAAALRVVMHRINMPDTLEELVKRLQSPDPETRCRAALVVSGCLTMKNMKVPLEEYGVIDVLHKHVRLAADTPNPDELIFMLEPLFELSLRSQETRQHLLEEDILPVLEEAVEHPERYGMPAVRASIALMHSIITHEISTARKRVRLSTLRALISSSLLFITASSTLKLCVHMLVLLGVNAPVVDSAGKAILPVSLFTADYCHYCVQWMLASDRVLRYWTLGLVYDMVRKGEIKRKKEEDTHRIGDGRRGYVALDRGKGEVVVAK